MTAKITSLNAATATGAGISADLYVPHAVHSMQVVVTGAPATCKVDLEGSMDRTNWKVLTTWDVTVQSSGDIITASAFAGTGIKAYPAVPYVRANLTTLTGGTAPTVTAMIASVGGW